jgi:hypothetical protein
VINKKITNVKDVTKLNSGTDQIPFIKDNNLVVGSREECEENYYKYIHKSVWHVKTNVKNIVEIGAGFGRLILRLNNETEFRNILFEGYEYTDNGVKLLEYLNNYNKVKIVTGKCDLLKLKTFKRNESSKSLVFLSQTIMYLKGFCQKTIDDLKMHNFRYFLFIEPCYELIDNKSLLGLMQRKYIISNDYNLTIFSEIKKAERLNKLKISDLTINVVAENALLPLSLICGEFLYD